MKRTVKGFLSAVMAVCLICFPAMPVNLMAEEVHRTGIGLSGEFIPSEGEGSWEEIATESKEAGFTPRTTAPDRGDTRYYGGANPYPAQGANCTWYVFGRAWEIMGSRPFVWQGDACRWWYNNDGYPRGSQPRLGAVMCWGAAGSNPYGHVAVVEAINADGTITFSESSYNPAYTFRTETKNAGNLSTSWNTFQGYIYIPGSGEPPTVKGGVMQEGYSPTIPDGDYQIISAVDPALTRGIDVPGDTYKIGNVDARLWNNRGKRYDVYHVEYLNNGFYKITHHGSGKAMDVDGASLDMGANVGFYSDNGSNAQQWAISEYDIGAEKWYRIQSRCNGWYLDVENGAYADNTNIRMWIANGGNAQNWLFVPWTEESERVLPDGDYRIAAKLDPNYTLTALEGDYPNVVLKNAGRGVFHVAYNEQEKNYQIVYQWDRKEKFLDIETNGSTSKNVGLWSEITTYTAPFETVQKWVIRKTPEGDAYQIESLRNGLFLDVLNGIPEDGQNIQVHTSNQADAQKWLFLPVEEEQEKADPSIVFLSDGTVYQIQHVKEGSSVIRPGDPVREGYVFAGWFKDPECTEPFDFEAAITKDTSVYAKWDMAENDETVILVSGQKTDLKGLFFPEEKIDRFLVTDGAVASVTKQGILTAKKKGQVSVEAQVKEGKNTYRTVGTCSLTILEKPKLKLTRVMTFADQQLNANNFFTTGDTAGVRITKWESAKESVAAIDEQGILTAKAQGSSKITAYFGNPGEKGTVKVSSTVTVRFPSFSKEELSTVTGARLVVSMKNVSAANPPEWSSEDEKVFLAEPQQNAKGKLTGKAVLEIRNPGEALLKALIDGKEYSFLVKVKEPTLNTAAISLKPGRSFTLSLKNTKLKKKDFVWKSSDDTIAKVDQNGKVTAVSASGEGVEIYATRDEMTLKCYVAVTE